MPDIEILDMIEPEEFYKSIKREALPDDCHGIDAIRLTFRDGTVKYIGTDAVPTLTLAGEPFEEQEVENGS